MSLTWVWCGSALDPWCLAISEAEVDSVSWQAALKSCLPDPDECTVRVLVQRRIRQLWYTEILVSPGDLETRELVLLVRKRLARRWRAGSFRVERSPGSFASVRVEEGLVREWRDACVDTTMPLVPCGRYEEGSQGSVCFPDAKVLPRCTAALGLLLLCLVTVFQATRSAAPPPLVSAEPRSTAPVDQPALAALRSLAVSGADIESYRSDPQGGAAVIVGSDVIAKYSEIKKVWKTLELKAIQTKPGGERGDLAWKGYAHEASP